MQSTFGLPTPREAMLFSSHDMVLDDLSRQIAATKAHRGTSRGISSQRTGSTMRVAKPSSTSNSPRSHALSSRRNTMISDGYPTKRHLYPESTANTGHTRGSNNNTQHHSGRPARPVSWHPSSHLHIQQRPVQHMPQTTSHPYPLPTPNIYSDHDSYFMQSHFSPSMAPLSNGTSPGSTFSALPSSYQNVDISCYPPYGYSDLSLYSTLPLNNGNHAIDYRAGPNPSMTSYNNGETLLTDSLSTTALDWNSFIRHGFNTTTPPTPELLPSSQQLNPTVSGEAQHQSLGEVEDDSEVLVGMGLYDAPEKIEVDSQLLKYRSTISSLLGSTFHSHEPMGKGLKLEETWEPPESDDGEAEDDGDDDEEVDSIQGCI